MGNRQNFKSFLLVFVMVILPFLLTHLAEAQSWEQFIVKAEESLNEGEESEAEHYFYAARDFALKQDSWLGVVRTGYGFAALGNSEEAIQSWFISRDIATKQQSWEGLFRAAQGLAMLENYEEAYETIRMQRDIATKQQSWEGLFRAAQGLTMLENYEEAYETIRIQRDIATKQQSWEGLFRATQGLNFINPQNEVEHLYEEAELIAQKQGEEAKESLGKRIKFFTDTLLIQTMTGLKPGLADKWEITTDDKVVIFLREGINFFNGNEFNASSVETTFERNQEKWERLGIQSVERMDEYTVQISPGHLLFALTDPETSIQHP